MLRRAGRRCSGWPCRLCNSHSRVCYWVRELSREHGGNAMGEGSTEALVEEQKQQGDLEAFGGLSVGIAGAMALEQAVSLELAQVPEMPGCWTSPINWQPSWLGMAIRSRFSCRRLPPALPSDGRGTIALRGLPSSTPTVIRDGLEPSSGILRRRSPESVSLKISNIFG
jgi:hypothetical protein